MQKNLTSYIKMIEGNLFQFICDPNAQTQHAKEFLFEVIKWIGEIEEYAKALQQAQQAEQAKLQESSSPETDEVKHEAVA